MSKSIEIPLEQRIIKSVPVRFPDKCVYCGAPKHTSIPRTITRTYYVLDQSEVSYALTPIDIPYCNQHFNEIKSADARSMKVADPVGYVSFVVLTILLFLVLYEPIYNWGFDAMNEFRGRYYSMLGGFLGAVVSILFLGGGIAFGISALTWSIVRWTMKPPDGLKTAAGENLGFTFKNEQIADEFLALNKDLGAREYSFKQTFQESMERTKKIREKSDLPISVEPSIAVEKKTVETVEAPNGSVLEPSREADSHKELISTDKIVQSRKKLGWILAIVGILISLVGLCLFAPFVVQLSDTAGVRYSVGESLQAIGCCPTPVLLLGLLLLFGGFFYHRSAKKMSVVAASDRGPGRSEGI